MASPGAGAPALKYGYVNTVTPSHGEVKGLIHNKVSSVKDNKIINIDNPINNDNLSNSENNEINPKLEYNNDNHLEKGKQLINLKNRSTIDL